MKERIDKFLFKPVDHVVHLDLFYDLIIKKLAKNSESSVSETLKHIVVNWVNEKHNFLKNQYGINFREIMENIEKEKLTWKIMMESEIEKAYRSQIIKKTIQDLVNYSEFFNEIELEILAEKLEVSSKLLRKIISMYKYDLEEKGVKLRIRGKLIIKE